MNPEQRGPSQEQIKSDIRDRAMDTVREMHNDLVAFIDKHTTGDQSEIKELKEEMFRVLNDGFFHYDEGKFRVASVSGRAKERFVSVEQVVSAISSLKGRFEGNNCSVEDMRINLRNTILGEPFPEPPQEQIKTDTEQTPPLHGVPRPHATMDDQSMLTNRPEIQSQLASTFDAESLTDRQHDDMQEISDIIDADYAAAGEDLPQHRFIRKQEDNSPEDELFPDS